MANIVGPKVSFRPPGPALAAAAESSGRLASPTAGASETGPTPKTDVWVRKLHVLVFARYNNDDGKRILDDLAFLNHASGQEFHLVFAGYFADESKQEWMGLPEESTAVRVNHQDPWYFNARIFVEQFKHFERTTTWRYRGGVQLLIFDVETLNGRAAGVREMLQEGRTHFEHVIAIDVGELLEKKIITSFDHLFNTIRNLQGSASADSDAGPGPTWHLSDKLGFSKQGLALNILAQLFDLKLTAAALKTLELRHFAVRDIRPRLPTRPIE
jgi:hypothetical protein